MHNEHYPILRKCTLHSAVFALLALCYTLQALAISATNINDPDNCETNYRDISQFFAPHEVNSFMFKETGDDEDSSEINISLRYYFHSQLKAVKDAQSSGKKKDCKSVKYERANIRGFNPFFSYTAKFDFYWIPSGATRPSGPIVSRYQNPALHFRYQRAKANNWLDMSFEHISNGQSLVAKDNITLIQLAYMNNNHTIMDSISRVNASIALAFEASKSIGNSNVVSLKWYAHRVGQEADIYWGDYAYREVDFDDFQTFKLQWQNRFNSPFNSALPWQFNVEMNIGRLGIEESSWNLMLNTPFFISAYRLPLAFTLHRGPMNNMSDYTRHQNTFAVGFTFAY